MISNKKMFLGMFFVSWIFMFSFMISAQGSGVTYCAERTLEGVWCDDVPLEEVDQSYRFVPTSCESTSYCKLGTCVNSQEGICFENTAQRTCEAPIDDSAEGVWFDQEQEEIAQCTLGCCILGDQASFVTQVRCNQLSSLYGLDINYRTDIKSESACIASASSQNKGACVFEEEFQRTCRVTTQSECQTIDSGSESNAEFYEGLLCSAEELAANCGPSERTTLVEGRDEVYFVDTCGNLGNIYDANRAEDQSYWREMLSKSESCNPNDSNAGSNSCGNCDYFLGSTGKEYDRSIDSGSGAPLIGDYICRDLSCDYQGQDFQHGETWCSTSSGQANNNPGERHFRNVCYNGEVTVEACADYRQEICIEGSIGDFSTAACRVNKWQDCTSQDNINNCENTDRRDCSWIPGDRFDGETVNDEDRQGSCVPLSAPGFNYWQPDGDAESLCSLGNEQCVAVYEKDLFGDWECVKNCECLGEDWAEAKNDICVALGDCGSSINFEGSEGFYDVDDLIIIGERDEENELDRS